MTFINLKKSGSVRERKEKYTTNDSGGFFSFFSRSSRELSSQKNGQNDVERDEVPEKGINLASASRSMFNLSTQDARSITLHGGTDLDRDRSEIKSLHSALKEDRQNISFNEGTTLERGFNQGRGSSLSFNSNAFQGASMFKRMGSDLSQVSAIREINKVDQGQIKGQQEDQTSLANQSIQSIAHGNNQSQSQIQISQTSATNQIIPRPAFNRTSGSRSILPNNIGQGHGQALQGPQQARQEQVQGHNTHAGQMSQALVPTNHPRYNVNPNLLGRNQLQNVNQLPSSLTSNLPQQIMHPSTFVWVGKLSRKN